MENKETLLCKVVLIGESGVGKTSIIDRYISNSFSSFVLMTQGANFKTKYLCLKDYDQWIKFEIWDTGGQERFRVLNKIFYKTANVCILVYDITKKQSFEELKNIWVNDIKENISPNQSN